jgi:hypothetical protein
VPANPYTLIVGLPYTATAVTLRPELRANGQTMQGLRQKLVKVVTRLLETLGMKAGRPSGPLEELVDRPASAAMDAAIPLFSGDTAGLIEAEYDREGRARWVSSDPLPGVIVAAMLNIDVDARDA